MKLIYRPKIVSLRGIAVGIVIIYYDQCITFDYIPFRGQLVVAEILL